MIELIRHFVSNSAGIAFAVIFVATCYGIGRTISNARDAPRRPRGKIKM
ncbi:hypothetical protein HYV74_04150 [Candidatus Uhrbacteria bacterium]|nr:hypothetical protein [Candidatus Uhrbacteria bacterium]